jgi:hypothetical protein
VGLGLVTAKVVYPKEQQLNMLLLTLAILAMFAYMMNVAGQLFLATFIRNSAAIVWTNLTPLFGACAGGWLLHLEKIPIRRRSLMTLFLWIASLGSLVWPSLGPILRPPPDSEHIVEQGMILQSARATCSPAAAANLLTQAGIATTEAELIPLCLTDESGTPTLGLYRGLKIVAAKHGRSIKILETNLDGLLNRNSWPVLLTVELPAYGVEDPRYEAEWGWIPGTGHSVVAVDRLPNGDLLIADPSVGLEAWSAEDLKILWHGEGLFIE